MGFPGGSEVKSPPEMQETQFGPWVGKILWRREWQPIPVFLSGEFHGQRSLIGDSPWGCRVGYDWATKTFTFICSYRSGFHLGFNNNNIFSTTNLRRYPIVPVQSSRSVMSDSLWPHESQHARPPCLSPTPGVYSNSCPSSRWCHPAISSSVTPFSSCPQSLPASGSFPMSQLLAWACQSIGVSASASVLPMNTQDWSF